MNGPALSCENAAGKRAFGLLNGAGVTDHESLASISRGSEDVGSPRRRLQEWSDRRKLWSFLQMQKAHWKRDCGIHFFVWIGPPHSYPWYVLIIFPQAPHNTPAILTPRSSTARCSSPPSTSLLSVSLNTPANRTFLTSSTLSSNMTCSYSWPTV